MAGTLRSIFISIVTREIDATLCDLGSLLQTWFNFIPSLDK